MNEKIKEILAELTSIQLRYTKPLLLKDSKDELIDDYEELVLKMLHIITNLQEENERLNTELNAYKDEFCKDTIKKYELIMEQEYYKSRNEKAIEKIIKIQENAIKYGAYHDASICQDLLNILGGGEE